MDELQDLLKKRANARHILYLELKDLIPLLKVRPEEAIHVTLRIKNSIKELESLRKIFVSAHEEYVERTKEDATWDKEEMDFTIGECNTFMKKVE